MCLSGWARKFDLTTFEVEKSERMKPNADDSKISERSIAFCFDIESCVDSNQQKYQTIFTIWI